MAIQEELRVQPGGEEQDEPYEEEPRRRSWTAIASVVLALAVIFVGYQWQQAAGREQVLASQMHALRADAETLRLRADEAQRQVDALSKQLAAATAERETLTARLAAIEKSPPAAGRERAGAARTSTPGQKATPVVAKKRR